MAKRSRNTARSLNGPQSVNAAIKSICDMICRSSRADGVWERRASTRQRPVRG